jgi:hypothetical protein
MLWLLGTEYMSLVLPAGDRQAAAGEILDEFFLPNMIGQDEVRPFEAPAQGEPSERNRR